VEQLAEDVNAGLDLGAFFEPVELDELLPPPDVEGLTDRDAVPEPRATDIKTGDLFTLGDHRVLCGDCTKADDVARLMGGATVPLVHADPPYGMGKEKDGVVNDNLYREKLDAFQMAWWSAVRPYLEDNASAYVWGTAEDLWRLWYVGGLKESERVTMRSEIVWSKGSSGAGGMSLIGAEGVRQYPPSTERCLFFMLGEQGFNNNADNYWEGWESVRSSLATECQKMGWGAKDIERICGVGMYSHWFTKSQWTFIPEEHYRKLQAAAREHDAFKREHDDLKREFYATRAYFNNTHDNMTDVWEFPRVTGEDRHGHATPKPVAMIARAITSSTPEKGAVVDPFCGSGTTIIAAEQLGRKCYAIEIEPSYCQVTIDRWEAFTGKQATT
jgi:DNA modification methylase